MRDKQKLQTDLSALGTALKASRMVFKEYESNTTFNFNYFDVFKLNETHLTQAIAWFLNPDETHCQGDLFLRKFLSVIPLANKKELGKILDVSAEENIGEHGRLDIHIEYENYSIVIENKKWGKDAPGQLDKYSKWCDDRKKDYVMIFLTLDEQTPKNSNDWDDNSGRRSLTYKKHIYDWLSDVREECTAPKVRSFISEILQWIDFNVRGGNKTLTEEDVLKELITENKDIFKTLWDVINIFDFNKYLEQAVEDTKNQLRKKLEENFRDNYTIDYKHDYALFQKNTNQGYICLKKKTDSEIESKLSYCLESYNWDSGVYIGISKDDSNITFSNEQKILEKMIGVCSVLQGKMSQKTPTSWWIGFFYPSIIATWGEDYEFQMAWHLANPDKREELIDDIIHTFKELIAETEDLVELSTS